MSKETERRVIKTLEFLKEPRGIPIPTLVKAINVEGPQVSLKKIIQTLRGCLEEGIVKVAADGRVILKQQPATDSDSQPEDVDVDMRDDTADVNCQPKDTCPKTVPPGCGKPKPSSKPCSKPCPKPCSPACPKPKPCPKPCAPACAKPKPCPKPCSKPCPDEEDDQANNECPEGEGGGDPDSPTDDQCQKPKPKCPKPKPKCPKPKPKCPKGKAKPKPKCPKPKPKCPKPKPKCPKPKPKCPKPKKCTNIKKASCFKK